MRLLKIPVLCGFVAAARGSPVAAAREGDAPPLFSNPEACEHCSRDCTVPYSIV